MKQINAGALVVATLLLTIMLGATASQSPPILDKSGSGLNSNGNSARATACVSVNLSFLKNIPGWVTSLIKGLSLDPSALFKKLSDEVSKLTSDVWGDITKVANKIASGAADVIKVINDLISGNISDEMSTIIDDLVGYLSDAVQAAFSKLISSLPGLLNKLADSIFSLIDNAIQSMANLVNELSVPSIPSSLFSSIQSSFLSALQDLGSFFDTIISDISSFISNIDISIPGLFGSSNTVAASSNGIAVAANLILDGIKKSCKTIPPAIFNQFIKDTNNLANDGSATYRYANDIVVRISNIRKDSAAIVNMVDNVGNVIGPGNVIGEETLGISKSGFNENAYVGYANKGSGILNGIYLSAKQSQTGSLCVGLGITSSYIDAIAAKVNDINAQVGAIDADVQALIGANGMGYKFDADIQAYSKDLALAPIKSCAVIKNPTADLVAAVAAVTYLGTREPQVKDALNSMGKFNDKLKADYNKMSKDISKVTKIAANPLSLVKQLNNLNPLGGVTVNPQDINAIKSGYELAMRPTNDLINIALGNLTKVDNIMANVVKFNGRVQAASADVIKVLGKIDKNVISEIGSTASPTFCSAVSNAADKGEAYCNAIRSAAYITGNIDTELAFITQNVADIPNSVAMLRYSVYALQGSLLSTRANIIRVDSDLSNIASVLSQNGGKLTCSVQAKIGGNLADIGTGLQSVVQDAENVYTATEGTIALIELSAESIKTDIVMIIETIKIIIADIKAIALVFYYASQGVGSSATPLPKFGACIGVGATVVTTNYPNAGNGCVISLSAVYDAQTNQVAIQADLIVVLQRLFDPSQISSQLKTNVQDAVAADLTSAIKVQATVDIGKNVQVGVGAALQGAFTESAWSGMWSNIYSASKAGVNSALNAGINQQTWTAYASGTDTGAEAIVQGAILSAIQAGVQASIDAQVSGSLSGGIVAGIKSQIAPGIQNAYSTGESASIKESVKAGIWGAIQEDVKAAVKSALDSGFGTQVVQTELAQNVYNNIYSSLQNDIRNGIQDTIQVRIQAQIQTDIVESTWESIRTQVMTAVQSALSQGLPATLWNSIWTNIGASIPGDVNAIYASVWQNVIYGTGDVEDRIGFGVLSALQTTVRQNFYSSIEAGIVASSESALSQSIDSAIYAIIKNGVQGGIQAQLTVSFSNNLWAGLKGSVAEAVRTTIEKDFATNFATAIKKVAKNCLLSTGISVLSGKLAGAPSTTTRPYPLLTLPPKPAPDNYTISSSLPRKINATSPAFAPLRLASIGGLVGQYGGAALSAIKNMVATATPPISVIQQYNQQNSGTLLTCPNKPSANPIDYFQSSPNSKIAGDACLATSQQLRTIVGITVTSTFGTGLRIGGQETFLSDLAQLVKEGLTADVTLARTTPATISSVRFTIGLDLSSLGALVGKLKINIPQGAIQNIENTLMAGPAAIVSIQNLGYSGMVQIGSTGDYEISSSYNTNTLIFQTPPPAVQRGLWTWTAQYADLSQVKPNQITAATSGPQRASLIELKGATNLVKDALSIVTGGAVPPSYGLYFCSYDYDYSWKVSVDSIDAGNIPIPTSISWQNGGNLDIARDFNDAYAVQYRQPQITGWAAAPVFPYLLYNVTLPASYSNLNSQINYLNESYDIYSPHNFLEPNAFLEPVPITAGSAFLANIGGVLEEFPYNSVSLSATSTNTFNSVVPLQMFIASAYGKTAAEAMQNYPAITGGSIAQPSGGADCINNGAAFGPYYYKDLFNPRVVNCRTKVDPVSLTAQTSGGSPGAECYFYEYTGGFFKFNFGRPYVYYCKFPLPYSNNLGGGTGSGPGGICTYADVVTGACTRGAVQTGNLISVPITNPVYVYAAPNGYVYVLNYSYSGGTLGFNPTTKANLYVLKFAPFGSFNIPGRLPQAIIAGTKPITDLTISGRKQLDFNQIGTTFNARWSGGTAPFEIKWYTGTNPDCTSPTGQKTLVQDDTGIGINEDLLKVFVPNTQWTSVGTYYYCVAVADSFGSTLQAVGVEITVNPSLTAVAAYMPNRQQIDANTQPDITSQMGAGNAVIIGNDQSPSVRVTWSGGTPPYTGTVYVLPMGLEGNSDLSVLLTRRALRTVPFNLRGNCNNYQSPNYGWYSTSSTGFEGDLNSGRIPAVQRMFGEPSGDIAFLCFVVSDSAGWSNASVLKDSSSGFWEPYLVLDIIGKKKPNEEIPEAPVFEAICPKQSPGACTAYPSTTITSYNLLASLQSGNSVLLSVKNAAGPSVKYGWYKTGSPINDCSGYKSFAQLAVSDPATTQSTTDAPSATAYYCAVSTNSISGAIGVSLPGEVYVNGVISDVRLSNAPAWGTTQTYDQLINNPEAYFKVDWLGASVADGAEIIAYNSVSQGQTCTGTVVPVVNEKENPTEGSQSAQSFGLPSGLPNLGASSELIELPGAGLQNLCVTVTDPKGSSASSPYLSVASSLGGLQISVPPGQSVSSEGNIDVQLSWTGGTQPFSYKVYSTYNGISPEVCDTNSDNAEQITIQSQGALSSSGGGYTETLSIPYVDSQPVCAEVDGTGAGIVSQYTALPAGLSVSQTTTSTTTSSTVTTVPTVRPRGLPIPPGIAAGQAQQEASASSARNATLVPLQFAASQAQQQVIDQWNSNWKQYWSDKLAEQSGDLYLVGDITLAQQSSSFFGLFSNFKQGMFNFLPTSLTTDLSGDLFILGKAQSGAIVSGILYSNGVATTLPIQVPNTRIIAPSSEFAVSPGGQIGYMADPVVPGNVMMFNMQNGRFTGNISLSYSNENYNLDIARYLSNGGPYGINDVSAAYSGAATANDVNANHEPLYITEYGGVLYVVDRWSFDAGKGPSAMLLLRAFYGNGTEVQIDPASSNDIAFAPSAGPAAPLAAPSGRLAYPPYGWPLAFNISLGNGQYNTGCIAGCDETPVVLKGGIYTNTNYKPLGPWIQASYACNLLGSIGTFLESALDTVLGIYAGNACGYNNVNTAMSFSSAFDGTGYITANVVSHQLSGQVDGSYNELLSFKLSVLNYTNPSGLADAGFACYLAPRSTGTDIDSFYSKLQQLNGPCTIARPLSPAWQAITAMESPVLGVPDAIGYVESQGSPQLDLTLPSAGSSVAIAANQNFQQNTQSAENLLSQGSLPESAPAAQAPSVPQEYIESKVGGSVLVPYVITYTETQTAIVTNRGFTKTPIWSSDLDSVVDLSSCKATSYISQATCDNGCTFTQYAYSTAAASPSTFNAVIEGGPTYLVYNNTNFNQFYQPDISDSRAILPPSIDYKVLTNRLFGEIYVNQSIMPNPLAKLDSAKITDVQDLVSKLSSLVSPGIQLPIMLSLNQTHLYDYLPVFYYQVYPNGGASSSYGLAVPAYVSVIAIPRQYTGFSSGFVQSVAQKGAQQAVTDLATSYQGPASFLKAAAEAAPFYYSLAYIVGDASLSGAYPGASSNAAMVAGYTLLGLLPQTLWCKGSQPGGMAAALVKLGSGDLYTLLSKLSGTDPFAICNNQLSYYDNTIPGTPSLLQLYDTYRQESRNYALRLGWRNSNAALGYNRLLYTFVDIFNNTITAPLDVDLANQTIISLTTNTDVLENNPNETTVTVSGVAGYYQDSIGGAFMPLPSGSPIYLYYDQNLNYYTSNTEMSPIALMGVSGITSLQDSPYGKYIDYVQLCAFGKGSDCRLANPVNGTQAVQTLQKGIAGPLNTYASIPTYQSPAAVNGCPAPSQGLLNTNSINALYECNIYGSYGLPATCAQVLKLGAPPLSELQKCAQTAATDVLHRQTPQCALANDYSICFNAYTNPQNIGSLGQLPYCVPVFANGTGTFTPQIGLLPSSDKGASIQTIGDLITKGGTALTDSNGNFNYQFSVCGTGTGKITASYYGAPFPQPANVLQSSLPLSNIPNAGLQSSQQQNYGEYWFSYSPANATTSFVVGSYALSFGATDALLVLAAIGATAAVLVLRRGSKRVGKRKPAVRRRSTVLHR